MTWTDGRYYKGHWKHGIPHGQGEGMDKSMKKFEGKWVDGQPAKKMPKTPKELKELKEEEERKIKEREDEIG